MIPSSDWILKTDRNVTLGLFHFIGPANSHTHMLPIHSAITTLCWLVCFSRASFAAHVNSELRQWDPWRVLHGRKVNKAMYIIMGMIRRPFKHLIKESLYKLLIHSHLHYCIYYWSPYLAKYIEKSYPAVVG